MKRRLVFAVINLAVAALNVWSALHGEHDAWLAGLLWFAAVLSVIAAILQILLYRMDRQDAAQDRRLAELEEQFRKEWLERP